jgi:hypothetical protein
MQRNVCSRTLSRVIVRRSYVSFVASSQLGKSPKAYSEISVFERAERPHNWTAGSDTASN